MARWAVEARGATIRQACADFAVSETCYRYQRRQSDENAVIADWLLRLTVNQKSWGFGMCYLYLRNVKRFDWNHKRVYRICRELELNLRVKPRKRLVRERPQSLTLPAACNQVWSMRKLPRQGHSLIPDSRGCGGLGKNINGGTRPRLSWGRSSLYSRSQVSTMSRTWSRFSNT